ncbi:collagen alpha-1(XVI) chain-like [Dreissena polymorpha]|uniref:collagen alpha-1(XVI) chain-like n=1 Tax=Dreissena polymorpha TaxID=45954 RepID=UPI0022646743|nr:collagen alpha-1(XVI) chain-like [Dreissena polymorpha]
MLDPTHVSHGGSSGIPLGNVHVDLPGEHGNQANVAVVHREGAPFPGHVDQPGSPGVPIGSVHVDLPGEHGNHGDMAVVHREGAPSPGHVDQPGSPGVPIGSVHVDLPGEHGNHGDMAVVHREGTLPTVDLWGSGFAPTGPLPGTQGFGFSPIAPLPEQGFHPGVHGDPIGRPGIPLGPVFPTNELPGTQNDPLRPRRPRGRGRGWRRRFQDDLLGPVGVNLPVVDSPAERGGRRGTHDHEHSVPAPTNPGSGSGKPEHKHPPSTPAPTNPGSGITVIEVRQPNPLGALGDALRSAFGISGGNGGNLLGSLLNNAANFQQPHFGQPPGMVHLVPHNFQQPPRFGPLPPPHFGPPPGMIHLAPGRHFHPPPVNPIDGLINSVLGNLFAG